MRRLLLTSSLATALAVGTALGGAASAAPVPAAASATAHYSETAYPTTKPKAGQYCKRAHRGVVTRASNGRKVRCTAEGSRSRWKYVS